MWPSPRQQTPRRMAFQFSWNLDASRFALFGAPRNGEKFFQNQKVRSAAINAAHFNVLGLAMFALSSYEFVILYELALPYRIERRERIYRRNKGSRSFNITVMAYQALSILKLLQRDASYDFRPNDRWEIFYPIYLRLFLRTRDKFLKRNCRKWVRGGIKSDG